MGIFGSKPAASTMTGNGTGIPLGAFVKDNLNQQTGIAVGRTIFHFGCVRIAVEPTELKDGVAPDIFNIDEQRAEIVELNRIAATPPAPQAFNLGDRVRDIVTGFKGLATAYHIELSGTSLYEVTPEELSKEGVPLKSSFFESGRLALVVPLPLKVSKDTNAGNGGPQDDYRRSPSPMSRR